MSMRQSCILCHFNNFKVFHNKFRGNRNVDAFQCDNCGLVFLSRIFELTQDKLDQFYEREYSKQYYEGFKADIRKSFDDKLNYQYERIRRLKNILTGANSLLELGCGSGCFLFACKRSIKNLVNITGIEKNTDERHFVNNELNILCFNKIEELENKKFDIIIMNQVLEHTLNPVKFINQYIPLLKNEGYLVIEVPSLTNPIVSLYKCHAFKDYWFQEPHLYYFNPHTLQILLEKFTTEKNVDVKLFQETSFINHHNWIIHNKSSRARSEAIDDNFPIQVENTSLESHLNILYSEFNKKYKRLLENFGYGDILLAVAKILF